MAELSASSSQALFQLFPRGGLIYSFKVNQKMRSNRGWASPYLALLLLSSCSGGGGEYSGPVGQVEGVVNLGDAPLKENATVTFLAAKEGHAMTGELTGDGKFKLKYNGSIDVPVGTYRIAVAPNLPESLRDTDPKSFFNANNTTKKMEKMVTKVPARYRQTGTSGVDIVVKEGKQKLQIDLDLK